MPNKWAGYLIVESEAPWAGDNYFIASIVQVTEWSPLPADKHFLSSEGEGTALNKAVEALKKHDQLTSLKIHLSKPKE